MKYNTRHYNAQRYNINGIFYVSSFLETLTETDSQQNSDFIKSLFDSFTLSDTTITSPDIGFSDFIFMDDMLQILFANKTLFDTIRLADWLSIERVHMNIEWSD